MFPLRTPVTYLLDAFGQDTRKELIRLKVTQDGASLESTNVVIFLTVDKWQEQINAQVMCVSLSGYGHVSECQEEA